MADENMKKNCKSKGYNLWLNLKLGYDFFENNRIPSNVNVDHGRYVFKSP